MARSYRKHTTKKVAQKVAKAAIRQGHKKARQAPVDADVQALYKAAKGVAEYAT